MRQARKRVKLGNIVISTGTQFFLSMLAVHRDKDVWGEDAREFNPLSFTEP